jgi:hypothetical protein
MAFRKTRDTAEHDQPATEVEAEIRETKIIAESLTHFKKAPDAPALPDLKDRSVAS